jgi:Na+-transporting NADH:ubiquinone oxidoreductase subunit NqrF
MDIKIPDEIFSIKSYTGTVTSNDNVATFIKFLKFDIDNNEILKFKAGGYALKIGVSTIVLYFHKLNLSQSDLYSSPITKSLKL